MESTHPLAAEPSGESLADSPPLRRRMPTERRSLTHKFCIAGHEEIDALWAQQDGTLEIPAFTQPQQVGLPNFQIRHGHELVGGNIENGLHRSALQASG